MRKFPGKHARRERMGEKAKKGLKSRLHALWLGRKGERRWWHTMRKRIFFSPPPPIWQICSHQKKMKNECSFIWHGISGKEGVLLHFGSSIFLLLLSKVEIEGASLGGVFSRHTHTHTPFFQITQTFFSPTLLLHFQRSKKTGDRGAKLFLSFSPGKFFSFSSAPSRTPYLFGKK